MIYADRKQFLLEGKNYGYAMFVNGDGFLQQLHYGGKMEKEDIGFLADTYLSTVPNHWINKDEAFDSLPSEYGFYAKGDYKEPTAIFERQDGASMSRLVLYNDKIEIYYNYTDSKKSDGDDRRTFIFYECEKSFEIERTKFGAEPLKLTYHIFLLI